MREPVIDKAQALLDLKEGQWGGLPERFIKKMHALHRAADAATPPLEMTFDGGGDDIARTSGAADSQAAVGGMTTRCVRMARRVLCAFFRTRHLYPRAGAHGAASIRGVGIHIGVASDVTCRAHTAHSRRSRGNGRRHQRHRGRMHRRGRAV